VCNVSHYNGLPLDVIPVESILGGTAFRVMFGGTFRIDYELSISNATLLALFTGTNTTVMTADTNTYIGTSSITNWLHGTWIRTIPTGGNFYMGVGSVSGSTQIALTGNIGTSYMIRLTFNKLL
jgi:hypothetical protein